MSNIFTPEGDLDYAEAAAELGRIDDHAGGTSVETITAAALVDIAVSLSVLAGTTDGTLPVATQATAGVERTAPARRGQAVVEYAPNDWVNFVGASEARVPLRVIAIGQSEGAQWVLLEGHSGRVWADQLVPAEASAAPAPRRAAKAKPALVERQEFADYDDNYVADGDDEDGADDALVLGDVPATKPKGKGKKKGKAVEL